MRKVILLIFSLLCFAVSAMAQGTLEEKFPARLALWVRASDFEGVLNDEDRVAEWGDARGKGPFMTSKDDGRPYFILNGASGTPSIYLNGDVNANPKINNYFEVPLQGEIPATTIFIVGTNLNRGGLIDTAAANRGTLRHIGSLQITNTRAGLPGPSWFSRNPDSVGILTLSAQLKNDWELHFDAFQNGEKIADTSIDPLTEQAVQYNNARIGNVNYIEQMFNGEIKEILFYIGYMTDKEREQIEGYLALRHGLIDPASVSTEVLEAHKMPYGYEIIEEVKIEKPPLPEVKSKPSTDRLVSWFRADDIKGLEDGDKVDSAPTVEGGTAYSEGIYRPTYLAEGLSGRPALKFEGNANANPRTYQWLEYPVAGSSYAVTIAMVGTNSLRNGGSIDTYPTGLGTIRNIGALQLTGNSSGLNHPFPLFTTESIVPQMSFIIVGIDEDGKQYMETYANGQFQARSTPSDPIQVIFKRPVTGTVNWGEQSFNGLVSEVMIFDKAIDEKERKQIESYFAEKYNVQVLTAEQVAKTRTSQSNRYPHFETYSFSWYGNSFSGKDAWVQSGISGINVFPDGTLIATSIWDEPHKEIGFYKDGKVVGPQHTSGGYAKITYDDEYLYLGKSGMGERLVGIARYKRSMEGNVLQKVPFSEGNKDGFVMIDTDEIWVEASGIALAGNTILLTVNGVDKVFMFNKETGAKNGEFNINAPGAIAIAPNNNLWIGNKYGVFEYSANGQLTGKSITDFSVSGLTISPQGELVISVQEDLHQVIYYDISGVRPQEIKRIGEMGGVYGAKRRGELSENRLYFPGDVAVDAAGNLYVCNHGKITRSYSPSGDMLWEIYSVIFCNASDFDPGTDGTVIYSKTMNFEYVPGAELGKEWRITGTSYDPYSYPEFADGTSHNAVVKELNGEIYRFGIADGVMVHKKIEGTEIFAPVAIYSNGRSTPQVVPSVLEQGKTRFLWVDFNGNNTVDENEIQYPDNNNYLSFGFSTWVDSEGNLWEPRTRAGLSKLPLTGFTESGAPVYDLSKFEVYGKPIEFLEILRVHYISETDTMYISGYTWENPVTGKEWLWGCAGRETICYTDWSKPTRKVRSRMVFPDLAWDIKSTWVVDEADLFFAADGTSSVIFVYNTISGELLGIIEPDPTIVGEVGWVDTDGGLRAYMKEDGSVLVIEEDSLAQKEMIYHLKPIKTK